MNRLLPLLLPFLLEVSATAQQPANLLPNPSFEAGNEVPQGWERFRPQGSTLSRDATVSRTGAASARIDLTPGCAAEYPNFSFPLQPVAAGEEYQGTVWARTRGMTDLGAYATIEFLTGNRRNHFISSDFTGPGDHDWMLLTVRGMVPTGVDNVRFQLVAHGTGQVWFDDAAFVRTAAAPAAFTGDQVRLTLRPDRVLCDRLWGFGAQGDFFLHCDFNASHGMTDRDISQALRRVEEMRPHILRTFFAYQWWEPQEGHHTPDSQWMKDYVFWLRFLQSIGCQVLLTPWGDCFAYPDWMRDGDQRLPRPAKRDAMVRSLVDLISYLRRDQGLDNLRTVCLMNEPTAVPVRGVDVGEYVRLNRLLDRGLRDRGLRDQVSLLGVDECQGGNTLSKGWLEEVASRGLEYADAVSVHTYLHEYVPGLVPWLKERQEVVRRAPGATRNLPLLITEFGYGGETYKNWRNQEYDYGLFLGDFAVTALRQGAAGALTWCLFDQYYTDQLKQEWGLWEFPPETAAEAGTAGKAGEAGTAGAVHPLPAARYPPLAPRPGFWAWSLVTRYSRPGSRVLDLAATPDSPQVHGVALRSPEGGLSLLVVNRTARPVRAALDLALTKPRLLRVYCYRPERVPVAGGEMLGAEATLRAEPARRLSLELPARSFTVMTDL